MSDQAPAPRQRSVPLFHPAARQGAMLCATAIVGLAAAYYLRLRVIEDGTFAGACAASPNDWICAVRDATVAAAAASAFGFAALVSALLHLWRPSLVLCALTLASAGLGFLLHNVALSALATALLPLSLARPAAAAG
jgi:hypothetical protein